jgi:hypothetical protein
VVDDSVSGVGGTMLTFEAILESNLEKLTFVSTKNLTLKDAFRDFDLFIFGNITNLNKNIIDVLVLIMETKPFVKIEFDYGYCIYRGRIPHEMLGGENCNCYKNHDLSTIYKLIHEKSLHTFYMSGEQIAIHNEDLSKINNISGRFKNPQSVLSSCFSKENLILFKELRKKPKNEKYAIIDGQGGWHTQAKGIKESVEYSKSKSLQFDLIKTDTHREMLNILSNYKGLVSMPIIHDTCPRITIEAKLMGLEVLTNNMSQHIRESWWNSDLETVFEFVKSRPNHFWETLKCLK